MSNRKWSWINVLAILCSICYDRLTEARTHNRYMTNYCSKSIEVIDSLVLSLTLTDDLPDGRDRDFVHCDVDLFAPAGMKLFAHFLQLGISSEVSHSDRLHLYDVYSNNTRLTPTKGLYGKLDRALSIYDSSGIQISDYRTVGNKMKVDYLGKPTKKSPGFRLLITNFYDPNKSGECPSRYYKCSNSRICIPRQTTCDGNRNCGKDDTGDDKGCDKFDTVTNLLVEYSLTRDIIVVILLPLFIFISFVIFTLLMAKRYIREKIIKPGLPSVHYSPKKDGQVRFEEITDKHAPPAYEDLLHMPKRYDLPPAYSGLSFLVDEGCTRAGDVANEARANVLEVDKESKSRFVLQSISTEDEENENLRMDPGSCEYENFRLHCVWPSDTDDDDEMKEKRRRKGGKGKVKGRKKDLEGSKLINIPKSSSESTPVKSLNSSMPSNNSSVVSADSSIASASSIESPPSSNCLAASCIQSDIKSLSRPAKYKSSGDFIPIHKRPTNSSHNSTSFNSKTTAAPLEIKVEKNYYTEKSSKTVTKPHLAAERIATEDSSCQKVFSSTGNSTNSLSKSNLTIGNQGNAIVNKLQLDDDQDADISGDSNSETSDVCRQTSKVTAALPKTRTANGHVACV